MQQRYCVPGKSVKYQYNIEMTPYGDEEHMSILVFINFVKDMDLIIYLESGSSIFSDQESDW